MKQVGQVPSAGTILVVKRLGDTRGFLIHEKHIACRRLGTVRMTGWVPGHGGDVWHVQHWNGDIAVYGFEDLEFAGWLRRAVWHTAVFVWYRLLKRKQSGMGHRAVKEGS